VARTPAPRPAARSIGRTATAAAAAPAAPAPSSAPRALARSAAAPARQGRPALTLVPTPPPEPPPAAPASASAPQAVSRSGVDDLAAAGNGAVSYGDNGMATIDFTGGGAPYIPPFSTAPVSVSRALEAPPAAAAASSSSSAPSASSGVEHPADDAKSPSADEMYEDMLERLRRDLLVELELNGHLLRDNP
jgi:hypothetical protein